MASSEIREHSFFIIRIVAPTQKSPPTGGEQLFYTFFQKKGGKSYPIFYPESAPPVHFYDFTFIQKHGK